MCLLFQKPADVSFTDEQLADMWHSNRDGFGVMYAKDNTLYIDKQVGKLEDWIAFFRKYEKEEACFHLRMRTHGNIDAENTHPYEVWGFDDKERGKKTPVAMMHNGVLTTGNKADPSKSDTWHFIRDYIKPLSEKDQSMIFKPQFRILVEDYIGSSNKFAIMDCYGHLTIMNRSAGIEWNGVWFSNTYAWSARNEKLYPGINKCHKYSYGYGTSSYGTGSSYNSGGYYSGSRSTVGRDDDEAYAEYWEGFRSNQNNPNKKKDDPITKATKDVVEGNVLPLPAPSKQSRNRLLPKKTKANKPAKSRTMGIGRWSKAQEQEGKKANPFVWESASTDGTVGEVRPIAQPFRADVEKLREMLNVISDGVNKWPSTQITDKMLEDNVSKFGAAAMAEVMLAYDEGDIFGMDMIDAMVNYDKMKHLIRRIYNSQLVKEQTKNESTT